MKEKDIRSRETQDRYLALIRNAPPQLQAAMAGAHIATVPFKVLQQMVHHPLTDKGIVQFKKDWEAARQAAGKGA